MLSLLFLSLLLSAALRSDAFIDLLEEDMPKVWNRSKPLYIIQSGRSMENVNSALFMVEKYFNYKKKVNVYNLTGNSQIPQCRASNLTQPKNKLADNRGGGFQKPRPNKVEYGDLSDMIIDMEDRMKTSKKIFVVRTHSEYKKKLENLLCFIQLKSPKRILVVTIVEDMLKPRPNMVPSASTRAVQTFPTAKTYPTVHKLQGYPSTTTRPHSWDVTTRKSPDLTKSETTDTRARRPTLSSTNRQPHLRTSTTTKPFPDSTQRHITDHQLQDFLSTTTQLHWRPSTTTKSPNRTQTETDDTGVGSSSLGNNLEVDSVEEILDSGTECWVFSSIASQPFSEPDRKQRKSHAMKNKLKRSSSSDSYDRQYLNSERILENVDEDDEQSLPTETLISNRGPGKYEETGRDDDPQSQGSQVSFASKPFSVPEWKQRKPHAMKNKLKRSTSSDSYAWQYFNLARILEKVDENDEQTFPTESLISNGGPGTNEETGRDDDPQSQGSQVSCESDACAISSSQMRKTLNTLMQIETATPNVHEAEPSAEFPLKQEDDDGTSGTTRPASSPEEDSNASHEWNVMPPVINKPNSDPTQQDVLEGNDYDRDKGSNKWSSFKKSVEKAKNVIGRFVGSVKESGKNVFEYLKGGFKEWKRKF